MVYFVLIIVVIFGVVKYDLYGDTQGRHRTIAFLWLYSILIMGLRYRVGIDSLNYIESYDYLPNLSQLNFSELFDSAYAPLYLILSAFSKSINPSFYTLQIFHTIIINTCIFYFIYKNSDRVFIGLLMYFVLYFLYFNTEILRESLAVSILLLNYKNFSDKKWIKYYLITIIAILFHYSASILLFFPLLRNLKLNFGYLFIIAIFIFVLLRLEPYLKFLEVFEQISKKVEVYVDSDKLNIVWVLYNLILTTIFPLFLLFIWKFVLKQNSRFEYLVCIHALLGIGIIFYQPIFFRFTNYTMPFYALFLVELISYAYNSLLGRKVFFKLLFLIIFIIYGSAYFLSTEYYAANSRRYNIWFPYHSIFDEKMEEKRETIWTNQFS